MLYQLLDLSIDAERRRVERAGEPLEVGGLSFELLAYMLSRGAAVVSFDELIASVWAPAVVNEETVTQRVKLLRHALGDDGRTPRYVRSVRGRGYQLCAAPVPPGTLPPLPRRAGLAPRWRGRSGRLIAASALALLTLAGAAAAWLMVHARRTAQQTAASSAGLQLLERARYYAGIGQRDNNERAIALYTQALRQNPQDPQAQLGLSFAYSSRVCLYNSAPEWADAAEVLARAVMRAQPRNSLAYSALASSEDCRGLIDAAISDYERAVALDPAARQGELGSLANLYETKGRLVDALKTNLRLLHEGLQWRYGDIQIARDLELLGFTDAAESRYAHSFQLYPDNVFSNIAWPRFLMCHGRLAEAQAALEQALARGTEHDQLFMLAGEMALLRGERGEALRAFKRAQALRPHHSLPATLVTLYDAGEPDAGWAQQRVAALRRSIASGDRWSVNWIEIGVLESALGDRSAATAALSDAVDAGFLDKAYLQSSPLLQPLAQDPGFGRVLDKIIRRTALQRQAVLASDWAPPALHLATAVP
ncbi:MAG TPA: winged helix-turn-helix domain-containing protein [Steroidobacteraceae bacterium]